MSDMSSATRACRPSACQATSAGTERHRSRSSPIQFRDAFSRVAETLAAAGASWADVVEMTTYHVGLQDHFDAFRRVRDEFVVEPYPAWTAVGVVELVAPGIIVEIAATAILDPE
jgi:enamine deaminase RidA (YjgF/YER057c/UK114 family)